ncbi:MAG TPA: hypothetical protein PLM07_12330 [Candidatus Rifleibacterium sp.]|nr:hypothetical protein [Candidatus Rifleibacterium sp.]HPT46675.1 hypothetical protein [Candidatus Rifleibacterium sp.]
MPKQIHHLSLIAGFTGFIANIAQVALFRFFMGQFYGTEIHLGLFLSIWLLGIAIGSLAGGRITFGTRFLLAGLFVLPLLSIGMLLIGPSLLPAPDGGLLPFAPVTGLMLATVLPVSLLTGMLIPCLIRLSQKSIGYFFSLEAFGGFVGGVFFSLLLGGTADSIICLLALPVLPLAVLTITSRKKALPALLTLLIAPMVWHFGPTAAGQIESAWWQRLHQLLVLEKSKETPYQKLQLASYYDQKSLYANGMLACSWPEGDANEARAHIFATALHEPGDILLVGAPTWEFVAELLKYPQAHLTIIENDAEVPGMLGYPEVENPRVKTIIDDPRRYLNQTSEPFDGIMICPVSPVTLVGNRLFTVEALHSLRQRLKPDGLLSLQVEGSENYLGTIKEKIILSTWQALKNEFMHCAAFPGSTITFFAAQKPFISDAKALATRFAGRHISTATFLPMSFFNLLMPFRVNELQQWLSKDQAFAMNTDAHPVTFIQQLELWNVYSGTSLNRLMRYMQQVSARQIFAAMLVGGFLLLLLPAFFSARVAAMAIINAGVALSGAAGLLCEIILILLYQNRYGAAYQMTALFFGLYMLGLAVGARTSARIQHRAEAVSKLRQVKIMQIAFTGSGIFIVNLPAMHSAPCIGMLIFVIAFLDGVEFPVSDSILRGSGRKAPAAAGLLLGSDSAGAMITGVLSGLWLLPAFGMQTCFAMLCLALIVNYGGLLLFSHKIHSA